MPYKRKQIHIKSSSPRDLHCELTKNTQSSKYVFELNAQ